MVEVVTQAKCSYCTQAKSWLRSRGIAFREIPASQRPDLMGVPVLITRKESVEGWSESAWQRAIDEDAIQTRPSSQALELVPPTPDYGTFSGSRTVTRTGASCGRRVTPTNVGVMLSTVAMTSFASEDIIPIAGLAGAIFYALGAWKGVCAVRALGTGLMGGAAVAAIKHCVQADRADIAAQSVGELLSGTAR